MIADLPDERRAGKAGLPDDDQDVTAGRVTEGSWEFGGKPDCAVHGAMNRVDPNRTEDGAYTYRCLMCGVGAKWWNNDEGWGKPYVEGQDEEKPVYDYSGRSGRMARNEQIEKFLDAWFSAEEGSGDIDLDELPGYRFTLRHDVLVRFRWSEWFRYPDGVTEQMASFEEDPIGFCIDAYLEPHHGDDSTEVVSRDLQVEYDPDEEFG